MNTNYKENLGKMTNGMTETITNVLGKIKEIPEEKKEGVSLVEITKKLSEKKFGKKK